MYKKGIKDTEEERECKSTKSMHVVCTLGRVNFQKKNFTTVEIEFLVQKMPKKNLGVLRPIFPLLDLGNRAVPNS